VLEVPLEAVETPVMIPFRYPLKDDVVPDPGRTPVIDAVIPAPIVAPAALS